MSALDTIQSFYTEAAASVLPLHRAIIFLAGFTASLAYTHPIGTSIFGTMLSFKLVDFTSLTRQPLSSASIGNIIAGAILVGLGWSFSKLVLAIVFRIAAKSTRLWSRVESSPNRRFMRNVETIADQQAAISLLDSLLKGPLVRLKSLNSFSEFCASIALLGCIAGLRGSRIDFAVGSIFAFATLMSTVIAVNVFLADCLGPSLLRAELLGRKRPTPLAHE